MATRKVVLVFNAYLVQLVTALKGVDAAAKAAVSQQLRRARVSALDPQSAAYIQAASESLDEAGGPAVAPGLSLRDLVGAGGASGERVALPFVRLLSVLAAAHRLQDDAAAAQTLRAIGAIQGRADDAAAQVAAVFDDDVHRALEALVECTETVAPPQCVADGSGGAPAGEEGQAFDPAFVESLEGSSIGAIAKGIAEKLDLDALKDIDPASMNLADLASGKGPLGEMVRTVGVEIQARIASGSVDQGALLADAMRLFKQMDANGALSRNPMMSGLMKHATAAAFGGGGDGASTGDERRDGLRAKLQAKREARGRQGA